MNIFILDRLPSAAARYHCDKHVVKMVVETAQLLSTAHFAVSFDDVDLIDGIWSIHGSRICAPSHINHPCAVWARRSSANYVWLHGLGVALCEQYKKRFARQHAFQLMLEHTLASPPPGVAESELTPFAQAMPDIYKREDAVEAYRIYYVAEKLRFARWRHSQKPYWLDDYFAELDKYG